MISCNLSKPESTFDQVRKEYTKLKPIDVALIATAIVESGHFAKVVHDGIDYTWPDDQDSLSKALLGDVIAAHAPPEGTVISTKKLTKAAKLKLAEETVIVKMSIPIKANQKAGEVVVGKRKDLKTLLGDILKEGVEYMHAPTDIRWKWCLERVNWTTVSGGELPHHVMFMPEFEDSSTGIELGPGGKRKTRKRAAKKAAVPKTAAPKRVAPKRVAPKAAAPKAAAPKAAAAKK